MDNAQGTEHNKESTTMTPDELWPKWLRYWRRMSSTDLSAYLTQTPPEKRLVILVWGVLESHGPALPLASDSMLAALASDQVAEQLEDAGITSPIIFDGWKDVGSRSATWNFPGAIGFHSSTPLIREMWEQTLTRMVDEGFTRFFLVNGDGGNWMNHWSGLKWDSKVIRDLSESHELILEGANWDQDGGARYLHGGHHEHALTTWACLHAPRSVKLSALRHGLRPPDEAVLASLDGAQHGYLEEEPHRSRDWSTYPDQGRLRSVTEFSLDAYRSLLYGPSGFPLTDPPIASDFNAKIQQLKSKIVPMFAE